MNKKVYDRLGETVFFETLESGLPVYVVQKRDFSQHYAFFAVNYGGMDMTYFMNGEKMTSPPGVAHFLEHKMFDTEDGNALQEMAARGASPNAFTSTDITAYYFECTDGFEENLRTLLSFVSVPYFTAESVEKEKGIIGQEIRMVEDNPNWCVYMNLLKAMYKNHPVNESVAGTVESISGITADTLYNCHKAFYNPRNMVLCVVGNVKPERIIEIAEEVLPCSEEIDVEHFYGEPETPDVCQESVEADMEVALPILYIGWKAEDIKESRFRRGIIAEIAGEALFGSSASLYTELYGKGLVNGGFDWDWENFEGGAYMMVGGDTKDPEAVKNAVAERIDEVVKNGFEEGLFDRLKRALIGKRIRGLDSFENICCGMAASHFEGYDWLTFPEIYDTVEESDVLKFIGETMCKERMSTSVIFPVKR